MTVSPTSLSFAKEQDDTGKTITATTSSDTIKAKSTETWAKVSVSGKTVTVKVSVNSGDERIAYVTIDGQTDAATIKVTQAKGN